MSVVSTIQYILQRNISLQAVLHNATPDKRSLPETRIMFNQAICGVRRAVSQVSG